jgi:hypothetical protein
MALILKETWKADMREAIRKEDFEYQTGIPVVAKWLVLELAIRKLDFRVMNLGAGVKLITRKTDICPKCKGTGRI